MTEKIVVDFDHHSKEYRERGMEIAREACEAPGGVERALRWLLVRDRPR